MSFTRRSRFGAESQAAVVELEPQVGELVAARLVMVRGIRVSTIELPVSTRWIEEPERMAQLEAPAQLSRTPEHRGGVGRVQPPVSRAIHRLARTERHD